MFRYFLIVFGGFIFAWGYQNSLFDLDMFRHPQDLAEQKEMHRLVLFFAALALVLAGLIL
jgi:hypothetical protein